MVDLEDVDFPVGRTVLVVDVPDPDLLELLPSSAGSVEIALALFSSVSDPGFSFLSLPNVKLIPKWNCPFLTFLVSILRLEDALFERKFSFGFKTPKAKMTIRQ